ncbi:Metal homeostatis protein BSD2 like [Verticillium longisporum]|uniref:Metal homeostatis protein BSD2 like n=1 Tax=Verticillium longisporum TaxID=100787 RepID=A0A8I3AR99_VERLO|nr:Metal homeostatis protein BSD2 like [Verticillium longisporum]KAG7136163.1 Metal homeostatis protein BSD2 like [Verticillium longisporum]
MTGRYERVHAQDEDDARTRSNITPNSPPPSFHSRQSSRERSRVDPTLADAFDTDGDDSDDEGDDRQRLVRGGNSRGASRPDTPTESPTDQSIPQFPPSQPSGASTTPYRVYGAGTDNGGVFSNLMAKPERATEEKEEMPPTYEQAALDAAPPYWETTILAPGLGGADEVYIDGMPVGSLFSFMWNAMISMFFQLVGFLLTYLLHSSHASKNGSLAGLGIQMIQYGFYLRGGPTEGDNAPPMNGEDGYASPPDPNSHNFNPDAVAGEAGGIGDMSGSDWISYILMIVGWFILIRSISEFLRARRHEQLVMQSPDRGLPVPIIATGESTERVV